MALILDTGPIYALYDLTDARHSVCRELIVAARERLVIPSPVLVEVEHLFVRDGHAGAFLILLNDIVRSAYRIEDLQPPDYERARQLCDRYADSDVGFVDAAVLAVTERLNEPKLATVDHRHFGMLRPRHVDALELLPALG